MPSVGLEKYLENGRFRFRVGASPNALSAGFGVRFVVPMLGPVPIALDFGFPIVRASTDRQQVFNFFMGFNR